MSRYKIDFEYLAKNISKSLLVNVNISIILTNSNYSNVIKVDGDPYPGLREREDGNLYLKFRFKEIGPREEEVIFGSAIVETKAINYRDLLYLDLRKAKSRKLQMLIYPEGLRRIKKISERLERKSKLIIDFEEELLGFIQRNFSIREIDEKLGLEHLLYRNEGAVEDIVDFIIAIHKHAKINCRKIQGFLIKEDGYKKHFWYEIKVGKNWIPIDPIYQNFGFIGEKYFARKIEYTEKMISDYLIDFKSSKKIYSRTLMLIPTDFTINKF